MKSASKNQGRGVITGIRPAGPDAQVVTVEGGSGGYCKAPCPECPWRVSNAGSFPAEAFRHSAGTAYDMARTVFACHMTGIKGGKTCAGFLLRGADHNLAVRLSFIKGDIQNDVRDHGAQLFDSYRDMAVASGVDAADPVLKPCR